LIRTEVVAHVLFRIPTVLTYYTRVIHLTVLADLKVTPKGRMISYKCPLSFGKYFAAHPLCIGLEQSLFHNSRITSEEFRM
jgi:hypothetical protein